jgi:hypothetical protein
MNSKNKLFICEQSKFTLSKNNDEINKKSKNVVLKENLLNLSIERNKLIKKVSDLKIITNQEKEKNKELNKILEDLTKNNNEQCMEILKNEKIIEQLNNKIMNLNSIKNNSN